MSEQAIITAIVPCQRFVGTHKIIVGRRTAARLSPRAIESLGLTVGQPWTDTLATQVTQTAEYEALLRQAARWVDRKMFSGAELADRLAEATGDSSLRGKVLQRMAELGLIDDGKLGRLLIEHEQCKAPAGPARLREKLAARKLPSDLIDQLLREQTQETGSQPDELLAQARKRLAAMAGLAPAIQARRLAGWLGRQGHDQDTVAGVMQRLGFTAGED